MVWSFINLSKKPLMILISIILQFLQILELHKFIFLCLQSLHHQASIFQRFTIWKCHSFFCFLFVFCSTIFIIVPFPWSRFYRDQDSQVGELQRLSHLKGTKWDFEDRGLPWWQKSLMFWVCFTCFISLHFVLRWL